MQIVRCLPPLLCVGVFWTKLCIHDKCMTVQMMGSYISGCCYLHYVDKASQLLAFMQEITVSLSCSGTPPSPSSSPPPPLSSSSYNYARPVPAVLLQIINVHWLPGAKLARGSNNMGIFVARSFCHIWLARGPQGIFVALYIHRKNLATGHSKMCLRSGMRPVLR